MDRISNFFMIVCLVIVDSSFEKTGTSSDYFFANMKKCQNVSSKCIVSPKVVSWSSNFCSCFESVIKNHKEPVIWPPDESFKPQLLCRTPTELTFRWSPEKDAAFFVIFLERYGESLRKHIVVTSNTFLTVKGLQPKSEYRATIRTAYTNGLITLEIKGDWITTLEETYKPGEIDNITVSEWISKNETLDAKATWEPSDDQSCHYDLVWYEGQNYFTKSIRNPEDLYQAFLTDLKYDTNYKIGISGIFEKNDTHTEGIKIWKPFTTPSCLSMNQNNLNICPPLKLTNLQVEEEPISNMNENSTGLFNVYVSWNVSKLVPEYVVIQLDVLGSDNHSDRVDYEETVSGNETVFVFEKIHVGYYYRVRIWGTSKGGSGPVCEAHRRLQIESNMYSEVQDNFHWKLLVLTPVGVTAAILTVIIICYRFRTQYKKKEKEEYFVGLHAKDMKSCIKRDDCDSLSDELNRFTTDEYEMPFENVILEDMLGEGAFGVVRKGLLKKNSGLQEVAVKMLREKPSREDIIQFRQEIDMLKAIGKHPHIVSLIGCCTKSSNQMLLIVEYCNYGDLQHYLQQARKEMTCCKKHEKFELKPFPFYENSRRTIAINQLYDLEICKDKTPGANIISYIDLLSFARQVAIGMEFLSSNRVVHRDIAARNVLVCKDRTVKISDFGLSRDVYERNFYLKGGDGKVPVKWMAVESLIYQKYTTQSDVWSFGILLWEIVTFGAVPYPGVPSAKIVQLLTNGYRMAKPSNCTPELYSLMLSCWRTKPCERPTFSELRIQLENILENSSPSQYVDFEKFNFGYLTTTQSSLTKTASTKNSNSTIGEELTELSDVSLKKHTMDYNYLRPITAEL